MGERQVTVNGETSILPKPVFVLATLNPIEMEGAFPLPEAQLDHFFLRFSMSYPSAEDESQMLDRFRQRSDPIAVEAVASALEIANAQTVVDQVRVSDIVKNYILSIIHAPSLIPTIKKRPTDTTRIRATQTCPINLWRAVSLRNRRTIPPIKRAHSATARWIATTTLTACALQPAPPPTLDC